MDEKRKVLVEMKDICKQYPGVTALSNVSFTLREGEIHSLCGENGAGKSTLIKILTGYEHKDGGSIFLEGKEIAPQTTLEAQKAGISTVYQEVNLCPNLSVAENIFIGRQPADRFGQISWSRMRKGAVAAMARLNMELDVDAHLEEYSVAVQQMVAIARAVDMEARVLVLDEPTSSLDANEVANLFDVIRKLQARGMGIIFISHFFEQVFELSDTITVLRNGQKIGTYDIQEIDRRSLVEKMLGRELAAFTETAESEKHRKKEQTPVYFRMEGVGKKGMIPPLDVTVEKGSIVGLAGLLGSGRTETARLLFGVDKADSGTFYLGTKKTRNASPQDAIHHGMAFCPENRKTEGLVLEMTVRDNIILALQGKMGMFHLIPKRRQRELADEYIKKLRIATPGSSQLVGNLSGGNQQKVLLARWLATDPDLFILDEPTRGIDVGAKAEILNLVLKLAEDGKSVVFISSEISEVIRCSDKVYIYKDRHIVGELEGEQVTEERVLSCIAESTASGAS
ncbi:sugar ABC transporter ATP-binding protein [Clostridium sp. AN503]|uniref:sugar ABC transporter ATP-binding protein n=1 Tax=Clostridium sp. AN503 TaxID=3160598 RepID=UPI003459F180